MTVGDRSYNTFEHMGLLAPPASLSSIKIVRISSLVTGSRKHVSGTSFRMYAVGSAVEAGKLSLILVPTDEKKII